VNEITSGKGARIIFDPVGGPGVEKLVDKRRPSGNLFEYGGRSPCSRRRSHERVGKGLSDARLTR
jgi:NADPH:quinone reductase-like Zn-dependent oxidoreductase